MPARCRGTRQCRHAVTGALHDFRAAVGEGAPGLVDYFCKQWRFLTEVAQLGGGELGYGFLFLPAGEGGQLVGNLLFRQSRVEPVLDGDDVFHVNPPFWAVKTAAHA